MTYVFRRSGTCSASPHDHRQSHDVLLGLLVFLLALCIFARTAAPTLSWHNGGADGGDLVTAAASLSVPHPPGYPVYLLLAQVFLHLPFGDEAYRLNLMSATFAAASVGMFYFLHSAGTATQGVNSRVSALVAAAALAFAPLFWSQATIAEVYTLHLFLLLLAAWLSHRWWTSRSARYAACLGFVIGLGLGNHLTFVLLLPVLVVVVVWSRSPHSIGDASPNPSEAGSPNLSLVLLICGIIAALSVYLYLPVASARGAYFHWGALDTPAAVWSHVNAELYHGYLLSASTVDLPARALEYLSRLVSDFQWLGVALAALGILSQTVRRVASPQIILMAWVVVSHFVFALAYNTPDSFVYLLPAWLVVAWGIGLGVRLLLTLPSVRTPTVVLLSRWLLLTALLRWPALDLSQDYSAWQFAQAALTGLPARSVLISSTDRQTFALWYFSEVEHMRGDVAVVDRDLIGYAPARTAMQQHWPTLLVPADGRIESFVSANREQRVIFQVDPGQASGTQTRLLTQVGAQE